MFIDFCSTNTNLDISSEEGMIKPDFEKAISYVRPKQSLVSNVFDASKDFTNYFKLTPKPSFDK